LPLAMRDKYVRLSSLTRAQAIFHGKVDVLGAEIVDLVAFHFRALVSVWKD